MYPAYQCARFVLDPKIEHGEAVTRWWGQYYLKGTCSMGTIMKTMANKELIVYSFCGDWDLGEATRDCDTARSRHGYINKYAGCPLLWKS
jgi:hypothetical protein